MKRQLTHSRAELLTHLPANQAIKMGVGAKSHNIQHNIAAMGRPASVVLRERANTMAAWAMRICCSTAWVSGGVS
ncbi:hypothetical protein [Ideonella paludis]|uniref:hypothetical protein n=1 Tax=Ideonella paludis TaxID=1233411 RepID=UPI00362FCD76